VFFVLFLFLCLLLLSVRCVTPRLSEHEGHHKLGQSTCDVRVALDGDSFTLLSVQFYFHR
jgi:hypothetical protein